MTVATDPELLILHTLRLKGFVDAEVVANVARLAESSASEILVLLAAQGFVAYRDGRIRGWSLTAAGRSEGERQLAAELDRAGCRPVVRAAYGQFVALNQKLLVACTRWQLRSIDDLTLVNDHTDAAYDAAVIGELDAIDDAVQPICQQLASVMDRFNHYNGRFVAARVRVHAGDHDWFAMPVIDSYHSVWFELHENLLATLNLERTAESR